VDGDPIDEVEGESGSNQRMLTWLTRRRRIRAAIASAAIYAACVVAPPIALAFADSAVAAHCLTEDNRGLADRHAQGDAPGVVHAHDDGTMHEHSNDAAPGSDEGEQTKQAASCCGLFCFVAVTGDLNLGVGQPAHASSVLPVLDEHLDGRGPDRINRPPIPLPSL
jgi:hypothetical protein